MVCIITSEPLRIILEMIYTLSIIFKTNYGVHYHISAIMHRFGDE